MPILHPDFQRLLSIIKQHDIKFTILGNPFHLTDDVWVCQMENYRDYSKVEKCSKCGLLAFCRGCPAVASGKDRNFYASDPQCWKEVVLS